MSNKFGGRFLLVFSLGLLTAIQPLSAQTGTTVKNPKFADADTDGMPDDWKPYPPGNGGTLVLASSPEGLVFKDNDKNAGLGLEQWIAVQEGYRYTATAKATGTGGVGLNLIFAKEIPARAGDLEKVKVSDKSGRAEAGKTTEVVAVAPAGAKWVKFWLYCPKVGVTDVVVQEVSFTSSDAPVAGATPAPTPAAGAPAAPTAPAAPSPAGPAPEGNLLKNSNFTDADTDGSPDDWKPYPPGNGGTLVLASAPGGGLVFKDADKDAGLGLEQWVPVQEGLRYAASADVTGTGGVTLQLIFAPEIPNRPGDLKKVQLAEKSSRAEAGKVTEVVGIAPAGAKWVKVWLYCPKIGVTDIVVKQLTLTASTPAPAAAAAAAQPVAKQSLPEGLAAVLDFETGDLSQAHEGRQEGGEVTVITSADGPVREGKYAAKIALKLDKHRAEVPGHRSDAYGVARYGWSIFIPKEFDAQTHFSIITQWHSWGSGRESPKDGGPPTCITVSKGKLQFKLLHQGDDGWTSKATYFPIGDIEEMRDNWTDFVMEVNWQGPGKGGWLKLYKNDQIVIDYTGTTWYDDKDKGPYFKFGTYKGSLQWKGTEEGAILYVDSGRMALGENSTYKLVAPSSYSPRPEKK